VVAPVIIIDGGNLSYTRKLTYLIKLVNIENNQTEIMKLDTDYIEYSFIKGIPDGTYFIKEMTVEWMQGFGVREINLSSYLVVKEGEIVFFPGKLVVFLIPETGQKSYINTTILNLDEHSKNRMIEDLKNQENFSLWENDSL